MGDSDRGCTEKRKTCVVNKILEKHALACKCHHGDEYNTVHFQDMNQTTAFLA